MRSFETQIELDVTVEYTYTKGRKGSRDKYGAPEDPDDEDEIEITAVNVKVPQPQLGKDQFKAVDIWDLLTKAQQDALETETWAELCEDQPDYDPPDKEPGITSFGFD